MPEFYAEMTPSDLDTFTRAYFEAMERTDIDPDDSEMQDATNFSPALIASAREACADFQEAHADLLKAAYATGYDETQAGVDFWLTRNRHGAGFWDRGLGKIGDDLSIAARGYGPCDLYVGDNSLIYGT